MKTLLELTGKYPGRISAQAGPLADVRSWRRMEEGRKNHADPFPMGGRLTGCGCIFNKISVRSDGTYIPCAMMPHVALGRINKDRLEDVWMHAEPLNILRKRPEIKLKDIPFCHGCPYTEFCTGNCPALAYSLVGDLNQPSPVDCLRDYLAAGGKLP
jgi:SynChlorMet cassette radical SAM/SPASM protein ScmE